MARSHNVLILENEQAWQKIYKLFLEDSHEDVFSANNVEEAMEILGRIDIDLIMGEFPIVRHLDPQISFLEWVKTTKPSIPILVITTERGFPPQATHRLKTEGGAVLFKEQLTRSDLLETIRSIFKEPLTSPHTEAILELDEELKFEFNYDWNVQDFTLFFLLVRTAYLFWVLTTKERLQRIFKYGFDNDIRKVWNVIYNDEIKEISYSLQVNWIQYASPGGISFKGLGEPIKEVRQFFNDLILSVAKWKKENAEVKKMNAEAELKEREVQKADLDIEERKLDLGKKRQENGIMLKKLEIETFIELEEKALKHIERRIDMLSKMGEAEEEFGKLLSKPLLESIHSSTYLIQEGKLLFPEQES